MMVMVVLMCRRCGGIVISPFTATHGGAAAAGVGDVDAVSLPPFSLFCLLQPQLNTARTVSLSLSPSSRPESRSWVGRTAAAAALIKKKDTRSSPLSPPPSTHTQCVVYSYIHSFSLTD